MLARVAGTVDLGIQAKLMKILSLTVYFGPNDVKKTEMKRMNWPRNMHTKDLPTSPELSCANTKAAPIVPKRKG